MSVTTPPPGAPVAMSSSQATAGAGASGPQMTTCSCGECQGLASVVRPRFFAGQVLTEVDLMALEGYAKTLHRMHNRYLHGWGIVCGLDLACENCGEGIVVNPGYALDPCGRDVVVPTAQQVPVGTLIADCLAAERAAIPACEPPTTGPPRGCDTDQHWCLTLRYTEVPMRPVTPLAGTSTSTTRSTCSCGGNDSAGNCGCGGGTPATGWSCTCGQGGSRSTQACGCTQYVTAPNLPPGCEPTRVAESFELGVCRCDGACCSLDSALAGTLPMQLAACVTTIRDVLTRRISAGQQRAMLDATFNQVSNAEQTRAGMCQLYDGVLSLYQSNPCRTTCQLPTELQQIDFSPQANGETNLLYNQRLTSGTQTLVMLVVAYLRDCICRALNPPCPVACDERIVLGCFTYSDAQVTQICNLECRRYAGSFVSRQYWLPIGPVVMYYLGELCCFPLLGSRGVTVTRFLDELDPTGNLRRVVVPDNFALVKRWPEQARAVLAKLTPAALRDRLSPSAAAVNLAALQGQLAGDATDALERAKVPVESVEIDTPDAVPVSRLGVVGVVEPGTAIRQYVYKGRVVGFGPALEADAAPAPAPDTPAQPNPANSG
jgi:hypothetical protein